MITIKKIRLRKLLNYFGLKRINHSTWVTGYDEDEIVDLSYLKSIRFAVMTIRDDAGIHHYMAIFDNLLCHSNNQISPVLITKMTVGKPLKVHSDTFRFGVIDPIKANKYMSLFVELITLLKKDTEDYINP